MYASTDDLFNEALPFTIVSYVAVIWSWEVGKAIKVFFMAPLSGILETFSARMISTSTMAARKKKNIPLFPT